MTNLFLFSLVYQNARANNIQVSNISINGQDVSAGVNNAANFTSIKFDLTWDNSWRVSTGPANWDAAWVFVKYRVGTGPWLHAFLNNSGHSSGTGTSATITPGLLNTSSAFNSTTNPAMGVFVHRSGNGSGTFTQTGLQLRWNYGANGVADGAVVDVKVFAVEMVYVPGGSFQVGDGTSNSIQGQFRNGSANTPLTISSENAITLGGTANGNLANNNTGGMLVPDDFNDAVTRTLPGDFPKGFNAFYCMKYEVSQQQWIDFFNTLDNTQMSNRDITDGILNMTGKASDAEVNRNNISWTSGDATLNGGTSGNVACNFLSWMDGAAFSDWASLRPMTELEYEKACRGPLNPVVDELAWGTTNITWATGITNSGANNEVASNAGANAAYNNNPNVQGPLRVGCFATATSTREQAGASHYGIMELSANLWERIVSVGHPTGRNFTRSVHGNGLLTSDGFCDISTWPGFVTNKVSGADGSGYRGGDWNNTNTTVLRVSSRYSASGVYTDRDNRQGFRSVRSAP
jgi:formylglycine-generating enzyme required for sulfatase activity